MTDAQFATLTTYLDVINFQLYCCTVAACFVFAALLFWLILKAMSSGGF